jgi:acyl-CoA synthetase (AMP-forming)/AMP-acid ligase II
MRDTCLQPDAAAWITGRPAPVDFGGPTDILFQSLSPSWAEQSVLSHFRSGVARFADNIAIDDGDARLTWREVDAAVERLAGKVVDATPDGGAVLAVIENTAVFPIVFLACLMTGRPIIPVDPFYPAAQCEAIARECGAALVLLGEGLAEPDGVPAALPRITVPSARALLDWPLAVTTTLAPPLDATAGVIYTSGSTGKPKGVAFSHRHLLASVAEYVNACHISARDRLAALASLSGASGREALAALLTGAMLCISDLRRTGVGGAFRALIQHQVTIVAFVPSVLASFATRPDAAAAMNSLRIVDLFGERVTPETIAALRAVLPSTCHIRVSLGSTETMTLFHWFVPRDFAIAGAGLPCGYLADHRSILLVDEAGEPVAPGEVGEVVVRGRNIASGYWRDGAVHAGPFAPDADDPESRVFHTGDLIRLRQGGLAEFVGRRDRRVKLHGLWADPSDVEAALHRLPAVADCAVVARTSGEDTMLLAYVTSGAPGTSPHAIRTALRAELPPYLMPAEVHIIASIPRLPNFKPDLVALARGGGAA